MCREYLVECEYKHVKNEKTTNLNTKCSNICSNVCFQSFNVYLNSISTRNSKLVIKSVSVIETSGPLGNTVKYISYRFSSSNTVQLCLIDDDFPLFLHKFH